VALGVADNVVILAQGQVAWSGTAASLAVDPDLKRTLLGGLA
jgi:ABC-type branched-subunit amino acid transport system ATPase component